VWSIETLPNLAEAARARLHGLGYEVEVQVGDGRLGWPEQAPFDGIIVTAAATDVPPALAAQLGENGRLVVPVGKSLWDQSLWLIERARGRLRRELLAEVRFVPLVATASRDQPEDPALDDVRRELHEMFEPRSDSGRA
jgi:protein-L-isoaspartate(D-aspartate) O-methyltransferase